MKNWQFFFLMGGIWFSSGTDTSHLINGSLWGVLGIIAVVNDIATRGKGDDK